MGRLRDGWQTVVATLLGSAVFIVLFLVFRWHVAVAIVLALGTFWGVYLISKPPYRVGKIKLDKVADPEQALAMLVEADKHLQSLKQAIPKLRNPTIKQETAQLYNTGAGIMQYLQKYPDRVHAAWRFLTYYLVTARDIIHKYLEFQNTNFMSPEIVNIESKTASTLPILNEAFERQFIHLMRNEIMDIETDIEVLKQTLESEASL
ncbi:MAG TPA: hypothetical protein GX717_08235 [Clostridiaceae bacterium]|nr:hypothetical protein [Clostridiaceae bacterium]